METTATRHETSKPKMEGIVYRTTCQNPGCSHTFDLQITPRNAGVLSGTLACPRCHRHGGMLKPQGRLANKLFSAKLIYRLTGVGPRSDEEDQYSGATELRY
jgi:hypothetical protein